MINKMKENKKLVAVLAIIPILILVIVLINTVSYSKNDAQPNNISQEQVVEGIKVSEAIIIQDKGLSNYTAKVTNTKEETTKVEGLTITFYDSNNKKITTLYGYVGRELEPNETISISASVDNDLKEANRVEIELKK